jgi:hypothetical protein
MSEICSIPAQHGGSPSKIRRILPIAAKDAMIGVDAADRAQVRTRTNC